MTAILVTFVALGLLHEYASAILFAPISQDYDNLTKACVTVGRCWYPIVRKQIVFFLWCGMAVLKEKSAGRFRLLQWIIHHLPTFVVSTLVVLSALPLRIGIAAIGL